MVSISRACASSCGIPFVFSDKQKSDSERGIEYSTMVGRLKPARRSPRPRRRPTRFQRRNAERLPDQKPFWVSSGFGGIVTGFLEQNVESVRAMLWPSRAGVLAALLIGCANVANLLLARASAASANSPSAPRLARAAADCFAS